MVACGSDPAKVGLHDRIFNYLVFSEAGKSTAFRLDPGIEPGEIFR